MHSGYQRENSQQAEDPVRRGGPREWPGPRPASVRPAGAQILLRLQGKMLGHLFMKALVGAPSGGEVREANEKAAQESHGRSSALTSKKRARRLFSDAPH